MDKNGGIKRCVITYPIDEHRGAALKTIIRAGINKVILVDENEFYLNLFTEAGLITDVRQILTGSVSLIIMSVADIISDAKKEYDEVSILLLPSDPVVTIGMYVAACMKKVEILTGVSAFDMKCLTLEPFPFINLNENEEFILIKIMENKEISTKNLFTTIKKEGYCNRLCSRYSEPTVKEISAFRYLHRTLNKLEKIGVIVKEKIGRHFIWRSTSFSELIVVQEK